MEKIKLYILLIVVVVLTGVYFFTFSHQIQQKREAVKNQEVVVRMNSAEEPEILNREIKISDEKKIEEVPEVVAAQKNIIISGFSYSDEANVELQNDSANNVLFQYVVTDEKNNTIFISKDIVPGTSDYLPAQEILSKGMHRLSFQINSKDIDDNTQKNGGIFIADIEVK